LIDGDGDANKQKFAPERGYLASSVIGLVMCVLLMRTVDATFCDLWKPRRRKDKDGP